MTHSEMVVVANNKFRAYTANQVAYALKDCHETLALNKDNIEYSKKLWVEIDALRDRSMILNKKK